MSVKIKDNAIIITERQPRFFDSDRDMLTWIRLDSFLNSAFLENWSKKATGASLYKHRYCFGMERFAPEYSLVIKEKKDRYYIANVIIRDPELSKSKIQYAINKQIKINNDKVPNKKS